MPTSSQSDVRWTVAGKLYSRLQTLPPGTREAEVTEHAISLALNSGRQSKNATFFFYDVLRNARHSTGRTQVRHSVLFNNLAAHSAQALDSVDYKTPEALCIADEIEDKIRDAAARSGPHTVHCFDGMLAGESVTETARRCGISTRSVERARQRIREIARPLFFSQEVG